MKTYSSLKVERTIVGGFLSLIVVGTFLIWSFNFAAGQPLSWVDSFFTATSALCVTGLSVVDTGKDLCLMSQGVVLALIQLGGLGVMTATTTLLLLLRQKIGIRQRLLFAGGLGLDTPAGAVRLLMRILKMTVIIEGIGMVPLFIAFVRDFPPLKALYLALFHSISAFCNAGFSPFSTSLEGYASTFWVPATIMALIVSGGAGFLVLSGIGRYVLRRDTLSPHCKLVIKVTASLIGGGLLLFLISDWNGAFKDLPPVLKVWNALFQSVTPRTAGFDTIQTSRFSALGIFITCLLMIIGASPGSTGGGIKTTTFALLILSTFSEMKGRGRIVFANRNIPFDNVRRALSMTLLYVSTVLFCIVLLSFTEELPFRALIFEAFSAMGTVGLSLGITSSLSSAGKIIMILLMFWGRVGILTFMYGMISRETRDNVNYATTNIPVG
ncbi:MAG: potassium transporter TrkG [Aminobacterium sp.]|uniref:TrkH family potassium uptake protein n=1 Tax=unclassified Aminobacterium TaxID=2685012 RepID=UPI001BCCB1BA|nr:MULTISPECIES: potassium transporter TrkG [unclassified Aminobacterium]MDD2206521.1 potassium transporter TrkG [Aminobacterium sp.]MDD3425933.1 potassium transporter TrkG [Aminobacterium sp.]MDD3707012.1 potassium transporter TrkG [Aminobacterium sp.]MDD4228439.1 potassium transporter TrkG [Aminobacterium sp.]MDD4551362.1 potassium transporter TrkG [Aminobacterium sp.]